MSKFAIKPFVIVAGVAIGFAIGWKYAEKKYRDIAQEEIDSVKELFREKEAAMAKKKENKPLKETDNEETYEKILKKYRDSEDTDKSESSEKPYVISPDEFGEFEDYEKISLIYYNDGVLTDENNEIVDDIDEIVGEDSLKHFGEYEEDSVFVRNDKLKCDYEILYDLRKYKNVSDNFRNWGVDGIKYEKRYK